MAFVPGYKSRLWVGPHVLSGECDSVNLKDDIMMLDHTVMNATAPAKSFLPGLASAVFSAGGPLDTDGTAGLQWDTFNTWKTGVDFPCTTAPNGTAVGAEVWMVDAYEAKLEIDTKVAGRNEWKLDSQVTGQSSPLGRVLHDMVAENSTGTGTEYDAGALSSNGGIGHLHVSAFSGLTSMAVKIQHSTTSGSGYADLLTFTTATATTYQRSLVAAGTTVNRFLQVVFTKVGTGSCTFGVSFARS